MNISKVPALAGGIFLFDGESRELDPTRPPRRFTPLDRRREATESFCIRDANGQALAYSY
jgi:hypothetical protein